VAVGFANSLTYFIPSLSEVITTVGGGAWTWTLTVKQLVGVASILILGGVNYIGVRSGSGANAVLTTAKVAGLAMLPVFALTSSQVAPAWTPITPAGVTAPLAAFGLTMIAVLWANDGFYFLTYAAGEVKDPTRNLPRALTFGLLAVLAIYLTVNLAYFVAMPIEQIAGTERIAEAAAAALIGPAGATLVATTVVVSTFGCNAAAILAGSRLLYGMASDGLFFKVAASVHPKFRSPHVAVAGITVWSSLLALSGSYQQLFTYVVFTSVLFSLFGGLALFRLRATRPDVQRPYRVWGYPIVPAVFVLGSVFVVINTIMDPEARVPALQGFVLLALGLPAYWYWRKDRS